MLRFPRVTLVDRRLPPSVRNYVMEATRSSSQSNDYPYPIIIDQATASLRRRLVDGRRHDQQGFTCFTALRTLPSCRIRHIEARLAEAKMYLPQVGVGQELDSPF